MATVSQFSLANRIIATIHKHPEGIDRFDLMDSPHIKISISNYNNIKPWLEHRYSGSIRYDKRLKKWYPIIVEDLK